MDCFVGGLLGARIVVLRKAFAGRLVQGVSREEHL